ncbi:hypothetical protein DOY81_005566 [Sarcophaga bullata]|nr:hypothetical protein DOY81_005566 [Sarcophaga bullata]
MNEKLYLKRKSKKKNKKIKKFQCAEAQAKIVIGYCKLRYCDMVPSSVTSG